MRTVAVTGLVLVLAAVALAPAAASAHPLGNFSVNHLAEVSVSTDRVAVTYVLDEAEIPTFQERGRAAAQMLQAKRDEVARRLVLTVDGRRVVLRPAERATLSHPPAAGGLPTTRVELPLAAAADNPRRVAIDDGTFPGRVGWKAIVAQPGTGTAVRSSAPATDPTNGLRIYPADLLKSPSDLRVARLDVAPGAGTLTAPDGKRTVSATRADHGFTKLFGEATAGQGVLLLLLVAAFGWGAVTRCRRGTARRWSPPTWSARAAGRDIRSRSGRSSPSPPPRACSSSARSRSPSRSTSSPRTSTRG